MSNYHRMDSKSAFRNAVEGTPDVENGYRTGLGAIRKCDRASFKVKDKTKVDGSLDIDGQTMALYPNDSRWDYAVGYNGKVHYVEVHPANTSDIDVMIKKKQWLVNWLTTNATKLNNLKAGTPKFLWVATASGIHICKHSSYAKKLAQVGLKPERLAVIG